MSSSSREMPRHMSRAAISRWAFILTAGGVGAAAQAQQTYWQPAFEARVEGHTNRDLTPDGEEEMMGYFADAAVTWGRRTERSDTRIRPRIRFQDFPQRSDLQRLEEYLDVITGYRTLRSDFGLKANYSRRDAYTAELLQAGFNPFDPSTPEQSGDTGRLFVSTRRTSISVRPTYTYRFTERDGITTNLIAEVVDYSSEVPVTQIDYRYGLAEVAWRRELDERTSLTVGPYFSRYDADDGSKTDAYGARMLWQREWSERLRASVTLGAQSEKTDDFDDVRVDESDTAWEAMLKLERDSEAGVLRLAAGRSITPSGSGSLADSDQVNVEYQRALSPRWSSTIAVRGLRVRAHNPAARGDDRDTANASLGFKWAMTPTWSVGMGYQFQYRKFVTDDQGNAFDNSLFLSMRFDGLGPRT